MKLRPGNVHSADDWDELLLPEIKRQQAAGTRVAFRADAAFAKPEIYEALEPRSVEYAIRVPANASLETEQWINEGKQAAHWTRLSCHRFRANEVRLQLSVLAYNLGNLWRRLVLPTRIDSWSLTQATRIRSHAPAAGVGCCGSWAAKSEMSDCVPSNLRGP